MQWLDLTFPTPEHNLACDEALLDWCEASSEDELLRVWEPRTHFVVLGYSNNIHTDAHLPSCRAARVPVLRRCSGGGTVLQGPGCLNFSLILRMRDAGPLASLSRTNAFVLQAHQQALEPRLGQPITIHRPTDLALGERKFSGNAQRRRQRCLLFHGTFLLDFDLGLVERLLPVPARQPAYRRNRPHAEFLTNLPVDADVVKHALQAAWGATEPVGELPHEQIDRLAATRYATDAWTYKRAIA